MTAWRRSAGLAFFGLLGCLLAVQNLNFARTIPARTAQVVVPSREPPLADRPLESIAPPTPRLGLPPCDPVDPATPVVALRVRAPASAPAGQELEYHIHVENSMRAAAH